MKFNILMMVALLASSTCFAADSSCISKEPLDQTVPGALEVSQAENCDDAITLATNLTGPIIKRIHAWSMAGEICRSEFRGEVEFETAYCEQASACSKKYKTHRGYNGSLMIVSCFAQAAQKISAQSDQP